MSLMHRLGSIAYHTPGVRQLMHRIARRKMQDPKWRAEMAKHLSVEHGLSIEDAERMIDTYMERRQST